MTPDKRRITLQPPQPDRGWSSDILDLKKPIVVPPTMGRLVVPCGVLRADGNPCPRAALWRNHRPLTTPPPAPTGKLPVLPGKWLWAGVMTQHFGHFLMESTGRLWGLTAHPDVAGLLFIPRRAEVHPVYPWQQDFFRLAGWTGAIHTVAEPTRVERLIVPGQGFGLGKIVTGTPAARQYFAQFAASIAPEGAEKLYISRSELSLNKGLLIGEQEMEARLAAEGYDIFHPQKHPLPVQIARYKAARQVIAAEGSAIHLFALVARPHQRFAMIVRRRSGATGMIEDHLRSFGGIEPVTLDALIRTWARPDQPRKRLGLGELNLPKLRDLLITAGFITGAGDAWPVLDAEVVRSRIGPEFQPQDVA